MIALDFGILISGAVVTETIFGIPGFGRLSLRRDQQARLPDDPGHRARHGHRLRGREPARGRRLLAARPADPGRGGAGMTDGRASRSRSPRARRRRLLRKRFLRRPVAVASLAIILASS